MIVSIEVPVIRGGWLMQCIDSVLAQTSSNWTLSLLWDGGDALSRQILEELATIGHPQIQVHFGERMGIARARKFLTEHSHGKLILPLDDDDVLEPVAVAHFIATALARPWAGIIRARRGFIDDSGAPVVMNDWFPFDRRRYFNGATLDLSNHSQPYVIRREDLLRTPGWHGFADFEFAGEDCSCFSQVEEVAGIELLDEVLYHYRIHDLRTSLRVDLSSANEMWRRIADEATARRCAPVRRVNDEPPFTYVAVAGERPSIADVDVVVPFWEADERELEYNSARPATWLDSAQFVLRADSHFSQVCEPPISGFDRLAIAMSSTGPTRGLLQLSLYDTKTSFTPTAVLRQGVNAADAFGFDFISFNLPGDCDRERAYDRMVLTFEPAFGSGEFLIVHTIRGVGNRETALMRLFERAPGHSRRGLERCLASLANAGIEKSSIHVIEERQSSAANRNKAFRRSSKPWVCFMDDDAELPDPSTLQQLLDCMRDSGAALCGPKLLTESRRIYSGLPYADPLTLETRVGGMGEVDNGQHDRNALVPWLPSTVLMTHRSVFLATGGFDEHFEGSQHEDADFSLRARDRGFTCCYVGRASAIHHNQLRNAHFSKNMRYFREKWQHRPDLFTSPLPLP
jgi:glycosyltransferase involved in cell wall biosynthesis